MDDIGKVSSTKARRRILSCSHCRRLKSRCEYDAHLRSCRRCHKLRIDCSLRADPAFSQPSARSTSDAPPDTDSRLSNVENALASIQESVHQIFLVLREQQAAGPSPLAAAEGEPGAAASDAASPADTTPSTTTPSTTARRRAEGDGGISTSAPIAVVRTFRPNARRLYEQPSRDIIAQHIVREDVADQLIASFLLRLGRVIQASTVADLTAAPSLRRASPLLHAVCCLQALRFFRDTDAVSAGVHRQLYEAVRRMLGQVVLATPIPLEELYAMLIMCTFEAAPRPVFEYIESWHLSGICAQQAISTIHFAEIVAHLDQGQHDPRDKQCLSLWNNICLVHLRFAVGTGKPATIPSTMLELCPAILDHPLATTDDGMVLAEIELLLALCSKAARPQLDARGSSPELAAWEQKWGHLLKIESALFLRFVREFAYLVLAMRLVDKFRKGPLDAPSTGSTSAMSDEAAIAGTGSRPRRRGRSTRNENNTTTTTPTLLPSPQVFQATAHRHALAVARLFLAMPTARVQELPKFHHICVAYCSLVLAECADHAPEAVRAAVFQVLADVCTHYRRFSDDLPAVMHVALAKMRLDLEHMQPPETDNNPAAALPSGPVPSDRNLDPILPSQDGDMSLDYFQEELGVPSFLTVDDFFGTWMMDAGGLA